MYVTVRDRPGGAASAGGRVATTVLLLGTVSLLTDVSSEMVASVLPLYLTAVVGLSPVAYGFLDGIYQGVSAFLRIAGGYAGDRAGYPKWVAVLGYGTSAVSRIVMPAATGFGAITAVVTADRLGKGLRTAPRDALIAEASDPAALGRAFGVHRALDTIGAALGPLVAFALLAAVPGGYDSIFVVSFAFAVAGLAVLVLFVPNLRTAAGTARVGLRRVAREVGGRRLRRPLVAAGLLGLVTVGDGFLYLALQDRDDFAGRWFPLLYVGTNVAYLALAVPLGRLADRLGRARVLVAGHGALLACYCLAALPAGGAGLTLVVLLLLGVFYAATDGVLPALVSRLVPDGTRGTGIASAQTVVALARFASSLMFGVLWGVTGPTTALMLFAVALALVAPLAWRLLR
ncbi:MFS transporter [Actinoplanes rectilineatus]|uniref:MFS transporter n=1 Tax=Actinoplanes rectilineatus TaxID=113571 RepID=UPI0005F299E1|nr:MFS transporter [Actinoplanes rectilineatus]